MINGYDDLMAIGRDNLDAMVQSGTLAAKGFEEFAKAYAAFTGAAFDRAYAAATELGEARTPVEFLEVQARLAREQGELMLAEGRKLAEIANTVAVSASGPLTARVRALSGFAAAA